MTSLEEMRKRYEMNELNSSDLLESPTEMFRFWFEKIEESESNFKNGRTSCKTVSLNKFDFSPFGNFIFLETQISRPTTCSDMASTLKFCGENISTSASNHITCSAPFSKSCRIAKSLAKSIIIGTLPAHFMTYSLGNSSITSSPNNM